MYEPFSKKGAFRYFYQKDSIFSKALIKNIMPNDNLSVKDTQSYEKKPIIPSNSTPAILDFSTPEPTQSNEDKEDRQRLEELLQSALVDKDGQYKDDPPVIEFLKDDRWIPAFGLNALTLIKGKAKAMKSTIISAIMAECVKGDGYFRWYHNESRQRVLWIDTEQKKAHAMKVHRFCKGIDPIVVCLRPFSDLEDRINLTLLAIEKYSSACSMVIIDGIVDLCPDFNSPEKSQEVVGLLMAASERHNVHVITVLHENKGNDFARGHLGGILGQKAELTLSSERTNEDIAEAKITPTDSRNENLQPFMVHATFGAIYRTQITPITKATKGRRQKPIIDACRLLISQDEDQQVRKTTLIEFLRNKYDHTKVNAKISIDHYISQGYLKTTGKTGAGLFILIGETNTDNLK